MGIIYEIVYHELVLVKDIPKISNTDKKRIRFVIEQKLQISPELFGKPLRKSLKNYRSLRVGDYRVIFRIEKMIVKIFVIMHRSVVYKNTLDRI